MDVLLFGRPSDYVVIQVFVNQINDVLAVLACVVTVLEREAYGEMVFERDILPDTHPRTATYARIALASASGIANCFALWLSVPAMAGRFPSRLDRVKKKLTSRR